MTVVFTVARPFAIVAACDSAVKEEIEGDVSYSTGAKSYCIEGVGVVTTWGARDGNSIGQFISKLRDTGHTPDVTELAAQVRSFLENDFNPRDRGSGDVGYHVAGFHNGVPHVYHVFWNAPGEGRPATGLYDTQQDNPGSGIFMLYNGREDLAHAMASALVGEIERGQRPPMGLGTALGLVALAHLVLRFSAELSHDVSPPFIANVIDEGNHIVTACLPDWQPLTDPSWKRMNDFTARIGKLVEVIKLLP